MPFLQHIQNVAASISGGFAALRHDARPPHMMQIESGHLSRDLKLSLSQLNGKRQLQFNDCGDSQFADVLIIDNGGNKIWADRAVLAARSPFFYRSFGDEGAGFGDSLQWSLEERSPLSLLKFTLPFRRESILVILEYIYTGILPSTDQYKPVESEIYDGVIKLMDLFELPHLDALDSSNQYMSDIARIWIDDSFERFANIKIQLEDTVVLAHQTFLASRCEFFGALLHGSRWLLNRDDEGFVVVDLKHISYRIFEKVLYWLYTDGTAEIFAEDRTDSEETLDNYIDFIVGVLATANELLLDRLKDICTDVLISLFDLSNVVDILEIADYFAAKKLKQACLNFR